MPLAVPLSQLDPQGLAEHGAKQHTRLQEQRSFLYREMFPSVPISTGTPQRAAPRPANTPGQHARGWSTASKSNCSHTTVGYHSGAKAILRLPQLPTAWELASKATRVKGASTEHPCQAQGVASTELQPGWDGCLAPGCSSPGSGRAAAVQVPVTGVTLRAWLGTSSLGQSRELQGIRARSCWLQRAFLRVLHWAGVALPVGSCPALSSWQRVMAAALSPSPPLLVPHAARRVPFPLTPGPMEAAVPLHHTVPAFTHFSRCEQP